MSQIQVTENSRLFLKNTEYSKLARKMQRFLNIPDDEWYHVHTTARGTGCGKVRRGYPIITRCQAAIPRKENI